MAKKVATTKDAFAAARDKLIAQPRLTAKESRTLMDMLDPGMIVRNFVSGNIATVRAICTEPGKPKFGYGTSPHVPITRTIMSGTRAGKEEETAWFILNVDLV